MLKNISTYPFFHFSLSFITTKKWNTLKDPTHCGYRDKLRNPNHDKEGKGNFSRSRILFIFSQNHIFEHILSGCFHANSKQDLFKIPKDNIRTPSDYFIANSEAFDASYKDIIVGGPTIPWRSLKKSFCLVLNVHVNTQENDWDQICLIPSYPIQE